MATIDIGQGAIDRASYSGATATIIAIGNPANDTGVLDTFEIYAADDMTGCKIGTFNGSDKDYTVRDYESIGSVTSGSKQTFTGKNCDVTLGDYLGIYFATGKCDAIGTGNEGLYKKAADCFSGGEQTYTLYVGDAVSTYATGATVAAGSLPLKNVFNRPFSGVFR
jgi:hypothetical protein